MSGTVKQFVDYSNNTAGDTGENNASSIQPYTNGENVNETVLNRSPESLRQRTESVRRVMEDTLYLRDADRSLIIAGPGLVSWAGSTTSGGDGIPVLSDTLWVMPVATPGFPQSAPVPPVKSAYGTLHLKRDSDSMNSILVTSQRRSYAAGDQISILVSAGGVYSCVLDTEVSGAYRRTIKIVATPATTLGTVIASLNGLTPPAPDNTQLVTAALEGGALSGDIILAAQAKQFVAGNYDGEGHAITAANLASFFSSNPTQALAEGDSLCVSYAMVADTAGTGGRRQALPENANTAIPAASYFNSRVHPENLVNCLPLCKVVNGALVFGTGVVIPSGAFGFSIMGANDSALQRIIRNGGFETSDGYSASRYGIIGWENKVDLAANGGFRVASTTVRTGKNSLEFNKANVAASDGQLSQWLWIPVMPAQRVRITAYVRQLIAPTAGDYLIRIAWGDQSGNVQSSEDFTFIALASTDASFRAVVFDTVVPASRYSIVGVSLIVDAVTSGSTGVALVIDDIQGYVEVPPAGLPPGTDDTYRLLQLTGIVLTDPVDTTVQKAIVRFADSGDNISNVAPIVESSPDSSGAVVVELGTQGTTPDPIAFSVLGQLWRIGARLLGSAGDARAPRIDTQFSGTHPYTLIWQSLPDAGAISAIRLYVTADGTFVLVHNASYNGTVWAKDQTGAAAAMWTMNGGNIGMHHRAADTAGTWSTWTEIGYFTGARFTTLATPFSQPLFQLYDAAGRRRIVRDHLGLPGGRINTIEENWIDLSTNPAVITNGLVIRIWTFNKSGTGAQARAAFNTTANEGTFGLEQTVGGGAGQAQASSAFLLGVVSSACPGPNIVIVMEWETAGVAITGASPGVTMRQGFAGGTNQWGAWFAKEEGNAHWKLVTSTSAPVSTKVDTGVNVTLGTQRMRIEMYGASFDGSRRVLGFINGVLVAESTTNLADLGLGMLFETVYVSAASAVVDISAVNVRWNRVASDDSV